MEHILGQEKEIEADMPLGLGRVLLIRRSWDEPIDIYGRSSEHRLELELLSQSRNARGCFPDHWGPSCFEPIGQMFFIPAEHLVHAKSDSRVQNSIACSFDPASVAAWFDGDLKWTSARLQHSLDIVNGKIRNLLLRIKEEVRNPGFACETMVELMAAQVAIEVSRHLTGVEERISRGGLQAWRLTLIDERLAENGTPPSLSELASLCNLSVRHLTRAFRASRGISIGSYIAERCMENAKRLLAAGNCVKSVAHAMGYTARRTSRPRFNVRPVRRPGSTSSARPHHHDPPKRGTQGALRPSRYPTACR